MTKKRGHQGEGAGATPGGSKGGGAAGAAGGSSGGGGTTTTNPPNGAPSIISKRYKQASLLPFLQTPAMLGDTPTLFPGKLAKQPSEWPTTAQRALENFKIRDTPAVTQGQLMPPPPNRPPAPEPSTLERREEGARQAAASARQQRHRRQQEEEEEDDFCISMSQTYQRSQPDPGYHAGEEDEEEEEDDQGGEDVEHSLRRSQCCYHGSATQHNNGASAAPWGSTLEGQDSNHPGQPFELPLEALPGPAHGEEDHTGGLPLPTTSAGPAVTPELCGGGGGAGDMHDDGTTTPPGLGPQQVPLFNIFVPNRAHQNVVLIRHGESEFNLATQTSKRFSDPDHIFDARLTDLGVKQARDLRPRVAEFLARHDDVLFVVSALSRGIQTFMHMNPFPDRLTSAGGSRALNIIIQPLAAEHLQTTGDVGRPCSALVTDFPQLAEQLQPLPERWWYEEPSKPNCALTGTLGSKEAKRVFEARVSRLRQWIRARPERLVVVVGHACLFRALARQPHYMKNCEVYTTTL